MRCPAPSRRRQNLASQRASAAGADRAAAVHDALVRKAQEKAAADVEAFKAQQRRAVAATVEIQRADSQRAAEKNAAVRAERCLRAARVRCLTVHRRRTASRT